MEPMSALAVACAVVAFVDFAGKLVSKSYEYYESADGVLEEHAEGTTVASQLAALTEGLNRSLTPLESARGLSAAEQALLTVSTDCKSIAEELARTLKALKLKDGKKIFRSVRGGIRSAWKAGDISTVEKRLARAKEQVFVHLLVVVNENQNRGLEQLILNASVLERNVLAAVRHCEEGLQDKLQALSKSLEGLNLKTSQSLLNHWVSDNYKHIDGIVTQLSVAVEEDQRNRISQMYLDSLYFPQIEERKSQIPEAHARTLRWVFDTPPEDPSKWPDFATWFIGSDTEGLYWITGKPGSGKSTLVRYLYDEKRTKKLLEAWAGPDLQLLTTSCFFWNPGTPMQKSQAGLLRSLLHGVLQQCPELIPSVSPWRWRAYDLGAKQLDNWSDIELTKALETCIKATSGHAKVCVFVDGLDEFEGTEENRDKIIELLKRIAAAENVKVCVSSRPWRVFEDNFGGYPTISMEDLNRHDIYMYVEDMLGVNPYFCRLKRTKERECKSLVSEMVRKSQGVFLWVYLVVRVLLRGLRDCEKLASLREYVDIMPGDLSKYFRRILDQIDPQHRKGAAAMFSIVTYSSDPLSVLSLSFVDEEVTNFGLAKLPQMSDDQMLEEVEETTIRLKARTKDLLEVHVKPKQGLLLRHKVNFLHRTVRDFLQTDDTQQTMKGFSDATSNPDSYICNALLAQIKMVEVNMWSNARSSSINDLLLATQNLLLHLEACEAHSPGDWCTNIRQELNLALWAQYKRIGIWPRHPEYGDLNWLAEKNARPSLLSFAVYWRMGGFTSEALQLPLLRLNEQQVLPLLYYCISSERWIVTFNRAGHIGQAPNAEITRMHLETGADPNEVVWTDNVTVAGQFLNDMATASRQEAWLSADSQGNVSLLSPQAQP